MKTLIIALLLCMQQGAPDREAIEAERKAKRIAQREAERANRFYKIAMLKSASDRRRANRDYLTAARYDFLRNQNAAQFHFATRQYTVPPAGVYSLGRSRSNGCCYPRSPYYYRKGY